MNVRDGCEAIQILGSRSCLREGVFHAETLRKSRQPLCSRHLTGLCNLSSPNSFSLSDYRSCSLHAPRSRPFMPMIILRFPHDDWSIAHLFPSSHLPHHLPQNFMLRPPLPPHLNLHTLQQPLLDIFPSDLHAHKCPMRRRIIQPFDRVPDLQYRIWGQGNCVRDRPLKYVAGLAWGARVGGVC